MWGAMGKKFKKLISIAAAAVMVISFGSVPTVSAASGDTIETKVTVTYGQTEARSMLDMINEFRTGDDAWAWNESNTVKEEYDGLKELVYDPALEQAAMQRAAELIFKFEHVRPNGSAVSTVFPSGYTAIGENIARGQETAEEAFIDWREDNKDYEGQGHRRNMLSSNYTAVGIAHVVYNGTHYWVQEFGNPTSVQSLPDAVDGEQDVTVEIPNEEQQVTAISLEGKDYVYYSRNSAEMLNAFAGTFSNVTVTTDKGMTYNVKAEWYYDAGARKLKVKEDSYSLPAPVTDAQNIITSAGIPVTGVTINEREWDAERGGRHYFGLHEEEELQIEIDPIYIGSISNWSWYKLDGSTLKQIAANGSGYEVAEVSPEDAGEYLAVYEIDDSFWLSHDKTVEVSAHNPVESGGKAPTCTEDGVTSKIVCSECNKVLQESQTIPALGHDWDNEKVTAQPTCTEEGTRTYTCSRCEATKTEAIPASGHKIVNDEKIDATCTEEGQEAGTHCSVCQEILSGHEVIPATGHTKVIDAAVSATCTKSGLSEGSHCSVCGDILSEQKTIEALGHNWNEGTVEKEATCTENGKIVFTCERCGETKSEVIPAKGHKEVTDEGTPATCTESGMSDGIHCSVCGVVLKEQEVIAPLGHTVAEDGEIPATCTQDGETAGSHCSVCGDILSGHEVIPATGHTEVEDAKVEPTCTEAGEEAGTHCKICGIILSGHEEIPATGHTLEKMNAVEPTCTEDGLTEGSICSVCGTVVVPQETVSRLGHDWDEGIVVTEETCTEEGAIRYTCLRCGESKTEPISAAGHTEEIIPGKPATCTESGTTDEKYCSVCGVIIEEAEVIPATGHTVVTDAGVEATCTESGLTEGSHCSVCGETLTAQMEIPATGHTVVTDPAVKPTYTEEGKTEGTHCSVCGMVIKEQEVIPMLQKAENADNGNGQSDTTDNADDKDTLNVPTAESTSNNETVLTNNGSGNSGNVSDLVQNRENANGSGQKTAAVKTGDRTDMIPYILLLIVAAVSAGVVLSRKQKR